ncbi:hypothetical protein ACTXT7_001142 [Hymenolepis weldensis]
MRPQDEKLPIFLAPYLSEYLDLETPSIIFPILRALGSLLQTQAPSLAFKEKTAKSMESEICRKTENAPFPTHKKVVESDVGIMTTRHPGIVGWLTTLSCSSSPSLTFSFSLFREFIKQAAVVPVLNDKPTDPNPKEERRLRAKRNG